MRYVDATRRYWLSRSFACARGLLMGAVPVWLGEEE